MKQTAITVLFVASCTVSVATGQEEGARQNSFRDSLRHLADSSIAREHNYADTLFRHGDAATRSALALLGSCIDSLVRDARDSIDGSARNTLRTTELGMRTTLGVLGFPARVSVNSLLRSFETDLPSLARMRSVCQGCSTPSDFESARSVFSGEADSLSSLYGDSMAAAVEAWEEALDDSVVAFTDSMTDVIERLKFDNAESLAARPASRLEASGNIQSHTSYRGRDNGVIESVFGPSLSYHHATGIFVGGEIQWVSRAAPGPDDVSLSGGYEFDISSNFDGSVSYTRYWYSDSSTRPQSVTDQNLEGTFTLDLDAVTLVGTLAYDFGGGSGGAEFTTSLVVAKDITVPERTLGGTLVLGPSFGATWGDQDERLRESRLERVKKKVVVVRSTKPSVLFGIMDYAFGFPATLHVGKFNVEPAFEYTIPADVLNSGRTLVNKDPSTSVPFVSAELTVTMTLK